MNEQVKSLWEKAKSDLQAARLCLAVSPDSTASRSYYAAFHAVSALFMLDGQVFKKHTAVEAAIHRDLVKPGLWSREVGAGYTRLMQLRQAGDYAITRRTTSEQAEEAIQIAESVLRAVAARRPDAFTGLEDALSK